MKKYRTVSIQQLKVGDYVIGIDKSWLETPFVSHRFRIQSLADIDRLKALGVSMVTLDADQSEFHPPPPGPVVPPEHPP